MEEQQKEVCKCEQLAVVKKGFDGHNAVSTFITIAVLSGVVIGLVIASQNSEDEARASVDALMHMESAAASHFIINSLMIGIASTASLLGLFAGTIKMNNLLSVCPKCGEVKELTKEKKVEFIRDAD